jgi:hypothetical protein
VPDRSGATPVELAEWYILNVGFGETPLVARGSASKIFSIGYGGGTLTMPFTPRPFGNDIYAQFGDNFALPVVGNFDPPVVPFSGNAAGPLTDTNPDNPLDVNADGIVSPLDALVVINTDQPSGQYIAQGAFAIQQWHLSGREWGFVHHALGCAAAGESFESSHRGRGSRGRVIGPAGDARPGQPAPDGGCLAWGGRSLVAGSTPFDGGCDGQCGDPADGFVDPEAGSAADVLFAEFGR